MSIRNQPNPQLNYFFITVEFLIGIRFIFAKNYIVMKALLLTTLFCFSILVLSAQSGVLKTIGGAAKTKVEQQDFNSSRSNKEKSNLRDERKRSSPAPGSASESAPAPAPPADTTAEPVAPEPVMSAKYNDSYTFGQQLTYAVDDPSEKEKGIGTVTFSYSDGAIMTTMPDKGACMLADFENASVISFDEDQKTAVAMNSRWAEKVVNGQAEQDGEVTVTKTGRSKQILGYNCEEYVIQGKTKSVCWVTTEVALDYAKTTAAIAHSMPGIKSEELTSEGLMMEMTGYNKKGVANVHMVLTKFTEEMVVKELNGYTVTRL
jgi:hypothetical protein